MFYFTGRRARSTCNEVPTCYIEVRRSSGIAYVIDHACSAQTSNIGLPGNPACPLPGARPLRHCTAEPHALTMWRERLDSPPHTRLPPLPAALQFLGTTASGLCVGPARGSVDVDRAAVISPSLCTHKYRLLSNGAIQHRPSGLCLRPYQGSTADGNHLVFSTACEAADAFVALPNNAMMHSRSIKCMKPRGGSTAPPDGTRAVLSSTCDYGFRFSYGPFASGAWVLLGLAGLRHPRFQGLQRGSRCRCHPCCTVRCGSHAGRELLYGGR